MEPGERARAAGPIAKGSYRVIVLEHDLRQTHKDFATLAEARRYADDAVSELEHDTPPIAHVVDDTFRVVHRGRPYA